MGYEIYKAELAEPTPADKRMDVRMDFINSHPNDAPELMSGFWRIVGAKTKADYPVAIYTQEGVTVFAIGGQKRPMNTVEHADDWHQFITGGWLKCMAVTRKDWEVACDTRFWPDQKPAVLMSQDEKLGIATEQSGGNDAPVEALLADQIEALADKLSKVAEPTTQEQADALTGDLDRMRALLNKAKTEREVEYRPHKEAADAVSQKWADIMKPGQDAGVSAEAKRKAFLTKEKKRLDDIAAEENRKRQEEARKAAQAERERLQKEADERAAEERERRRVEAEEAAKRAAEAAAAAADETAKAEAERLAAEAKAAEEAANSVQAEVVAEPEAVFEKVEAERPTAGTSFGRQSGLRKHKVGKIVSLPMLVNALLFPGDDKEPDADALAYFQDRANKAAKGGFPLPGTKIEDEYR